MFKENTTNYNHKNLTSLKEIINNNEVMSSLNISNNNLTSLEYCPKKINGWFDCSKNLLENLKFSPIIVEDRFSCYKNNLKSLEGVSKVIKHNFNCSFNKLERLDDFPEELGGSFYCFENNLKSLEGIKLIKINGDFDCNNNELETLKGSPKIVKGNFYCYKNKLKSLDYSPEIIDGDFDCSYNELTTLKGRPKEIKGVFNCSSNKLKNIRKQIIKYQIKAKKYETDFEHFSFEEIKKEFEINGNSNRKKLEEKITIQENKLKINKIDFGFGI